MDQVHAHMLAYAQQHAPALYVNRCIEFIDAALSRANAAFEVPPLQPVSLMEPLDAALAQDCALLEDDVDALGKRVVELRREVPELIASMHDNHDATADEPRRRTPVAASPVKGLAINLDESKSFVKHVSELVADLASRLPASLDRAERTIAAVKETRARPVPLPLDDAIEPRARKEEDAKVAQSRTVVHALEEARRKRAREA